MLDKPAKSYYLLIVTQDITKDQRFVKVDKDIYELLQGRSLFLRKQGKYNSIRLYNGSGESTIDLNQIIKPFDYNSQKVKYLNDDFFDRTRENINIIPRTNHKYTPNKKSTYKGVYYNPLTCMYLAYVTYEKKRIYLGSFKTEEKAARIVDCAIIHIGILPYLNFPNDIQPIPDKVIKAIKLKRKHIS